MRKVLFGGRAKGNEKIYKTFDTERLKDAPPPRNDELCSFEIGRCWIYKAIISCNSDPVKKKQTFNMRNFNAVFRRACVLPTIKR